MSLAPVALFAYNRIRHTLETVRALQTNELARQTDLFMFSDGPKSETDEAVISEIRNFLRKVDGFNTVTLIERERNLGLAQSVINGVTTIINQYGKVIAVEDDLLTANDFLAFMNQSLDWFETEIRVFSVSGFNFPTRAPHRYEYDAFCSYRSISWGWGTWKDRWEEADWEVKDFHEFLLNKNAQQTFNRGGDDLTDMLISQMEGRTDSWSIRWDYTHYKHDAVAILPVESRVYNIGFDSSGTHTGKQPFEQSALRRGEIRQFKFFDGLLIEPYFINQIKRIHRYSLKTRTSRMLRRIRSRMRSHWRRER